MTSVKTDYFGSSRWKRNQTILPSHGAGGCITV